MKSWVHVYCLPWSQLNQGTQCLSAMGKSKVFPPSQCEYWHCVQKISILSFSAWMFSLEEWYPTKIAPTKISEPCPLVQLCATTPVCNIHTGLLAAATQPTAQSTHSQLFYMSLCLHFLFPCCQSHGNPWSSARIRHLMICGHYNLI